MTVADIEVERLLPLIPQEREDSFGFLDSCEPRKPVDKSDRIVPSKNQREALVYKASIVDPRAWAALIAIRHDDLAISVEAVDTTALEYLPEPGLYSADSSKQDALRTNDWRNLSRRLEQETGSALYPLDLAPRINELDTIIHNDLIASLFGAVASANDEDADQVTHRHGAQTHAVLLRVLYARLGWFDHVLASSPYVLGDTFTDADANLFGVLLTFDLGYRPVFPTPDALISDYPHLWEYAKRIYHQSTLVTEQDKIALGLLADPQGQYRSLWKTPVEGAFLDGLRDAWND